jgi:hypothetical protein
MSENINVQYIGFQAKELVREYSFLVREGLNEAREFTLTIVNEAFISRRVSYQDGPGICSTRLHLELADVSNHSPRTQYSISEMDLDEYRKTHAPKSWGYPYKPKPKAPTFS